ncbi:MAG: outer membrane protein assembly factor BamD [Alphaproteobacteria bacterium]|nr:outer membrane protein assembly factor BamD [Alphaproteobacteria bacterium]
MKNLALILGLVLSVIACSSTSETTEPTSAEYLYNRGYKNLNKTRYTQAAENFEKIELEHPYSKWATKAKLMGAYAYYKDQKYDDAIMSLERFIKYHPGNKDIAYAYYMKGLCYYEQIVGIEKDQENSRLAMDAFNQVIVRFPDTEYAADARKKINLINDHLAGHEMEVGRFYLEQNNYLSALNRFSVVVNEYQTTGHIEEALYRQVEIYQTLGLGKEALDAARVLDYNYPKSKWNIRAQKLVKTDK